MVRQQIFPGQTSEASDGLHVGLVHWAFPPCVGGVETHLWSYARALTVRGLRVTVFTGTVGARSPGDGIRIRQHRLLDLSRPYRQSVGAVHEMRDWFRAELAAPGVGIRLVHGHNLHQFSAVPARALRLLKDELRLALPHTYHNLRRHPADERMARQCAVWDTHHAVSDFLARECADVLAQPVSRTYLGVDTSAFLDIPELDETGGRPIVLLPARLVPNKGAELAIRMVRDIIARGRDLRSPGPAVRPRLVLTDPSTTVDFRHEAEGFRARLRRLIHECGLAEGPGRDVEFREAGVDDMRKLYEEAAVVVYPSRFAEPMGLAPLEAMCAARPVVAMRVGGLRESGGILVAPGAGESEEALAARFADEVWQLLVEPSLARRIGAAGRAHVRAHFDLGPVHVDPMLDEYERLLAMRT